MSHDLDYGHNYDHGQDFVYFHEQRKLLCLTSERGTTLPKSQTGRSGGVPKKNFTYICQLSGTPTKWSYRLQQQQPLCSSQPKTEDVLLLFCQQVLIMMRVKICLGTIICNTRFFLLVNEDKMTKVG